MNKVQLTENGFRLENVFDQAFLNKVVQYADTFVPSEIRNSYDAPHLTESLQTAKRESIRLTRGSLARQITSYFPEIAYVKAIEFWRDYPGFRNAVHVDFEDVENIIIIYLGGSGGTDMGTAFYEDGTHIAEYTLNTGIMLRNSNKIDHHMYGVVSDVAYRKTVYINWKARD
jgi:hypothetical protein